MRFSVEMTVEEKGFANVSKGYLRDSEIELEDILRWTKSQLIVISDIALREEQAKGFDKKPVMLVDGRKDKNIKDVSPLGKVEFVARQQAGEIITYAYIALLELSKVLTGRYKSSHIVFINGTEVASDLLSLNIWLGTNPVFKDSDIVRIVNTQPYARKLELDGVSAGRIKARTINKKGKGPRAGVTIKKPNGAYQLALRRVSSKFKRNMDIRFSFIPGSQLGIASYFKRSRANSKSRKIETATGRFAKEDRASSGKTRTYLYPSLVFKVQERGIF